MDYVVAAQWTARITTIPHADVPLPRVPGRERKGWRKPCTTARGPSVARQPRRLCHVGASLLSGGRVNCRTLLTSARGWLPRALLLARCLGNVARAGAENGGGRQRPSMIDVRVMEAKCSSSLCAALPPPPPPLSRCMLITRMWGLARSCGSFCAR